MARSGKRLQWLVGITSLIVGVTTWFSYSVVRNLLFENITQNSFLEVQQSANELDQWLLARKAEVATLANTPSLRKMDWGESGAFLASEAEQLSDFYLFGLIYPDGSYYNTAVGPAIGQNLSDRQHFQEAMAGNIYASDPILSRTLGIPMVVITAPIWSDSSRTGEPIGVLSGLIDINRVTEVVDTLTYGEDSYAFALSTSGVPIVHPDPERMGTRNDQVPSLLDSGDSHEVAIAQAMVSKQQGIKRTRLENRPVYVSYLPLQQADWSIALIIPRQNIESQLQLLDLLAALVGGLIVAMIGILWHGSNVEKRQLKKSKELADTANRAKSKFLATMSHELRTPLNGILGYAQILLDTHGLAPKQTQQLTVIQQCGNHLLNLINDVLDIAKIEADRLELGHEDFYLFSFLDTLAEMFRLRAEQKGLTFQYELAPNLPTQICGDPKRLRQVLMNLLSNAIKFTPAGQIDFRVTSISSPEGEGKQAGLHRICFEVRDTGVGIAQHQLAKIFHPFEQVSHPDMNQEGTGLGLAISAQIVALMGSQLKVRSIPERGSQFSFELEIFAVETQVCKIHSNTTSKAIVTGYDGPPYLILIVDDKWINRSVLVNRLQAIGFKTIEASNGKEALEQAIAHKPNVIITDLIMPKMNGFELLHQVRQSESLHEVVAIASSASVLGAEQHRSLAAGAKAFLPKPIQMDRVLQLLETYLPLKWIYDEAFQDLSTEFSQLDFASGIKGDSSFGKIAPGCVSIKRNALLNLLDLAEIGDMDAIFRESERLKAKHPESIAFLQTLQQLSQNCQLDDLETILVRYLSI